MEDNNIASTTKNISTNKKQIINNIPSNINLNEAKKIALLIGPEGGFSDKERERILNYENVIPITLGPRILRADTAVISGLTLIQKFWGDW